MAAVVGVIATPLQTVRAIAVMEVPVLGVLLRRGTEFTYITAVPPLAAGMKRRY